MNLPDINGFTVLDLTSLLRHHSIVSLLKQECNARPTLISNLFSLITDLTFSDAYIKLGDSYIPFHRCLLFPRLPQWNLLFSKLLETYSNREVYMINKELDDVIDLPTLHGFIEFCYVGITFGTDHVTNRLYKIAKIIMDQSLNKMCLSLNRHNYKTLIPPAPELFPGIKINNFMKKFQSNRNYSIKEFDQ